MAKLTSKARNALPSKDFALSGRRFPINDKNHARDALARASQYASPEEKAEIRARVRKKFPSIKVEGEDAKPRADRSKRK